MSFLLDWSFLKHCASSRSSCYSIEISREDYYITKSVWVLSSSSILFFGICSFADIITYYPEPKRSICWLIITLWDSSSASLISSNDASIDSMSCWTFSGCVVSVGLAPITLISWACKDSFISAMILEPRYAVLDLELAVDVLTWLAMIGCKMRRPSFTSFSFFSS